MKLNSLVSTTVPFLNKNGATETLHLKEGENTIDDSVFKRCLPFIETLREQRLVHEHLPIHRFPEFVDMHDDEIRTVARKSGIPPESYPEGYLGRSQRAWLIEALTGARIDQGPTDALEVDVSKPVELQTLMGSAVELSPVELPPVELIPIPEMRDTGDLPTPIETPSVEWIEKVDSSKGTTSYTVTKSVDGSISCTCPHFVHKKPEGGCKHIKEAVARRI